MTQADVSITDGPRPADAYGHDGTNEGRRPDPLRFLLHLVEMVAAMGIGMGLGFSAFGELTAGSTTEAATRYPVLSVIVLAVSMTIPMVAWMRFRGHGLRGCAEMALAMIVPAAPILALYGVGVVTDPASVYCCTSMWAMVVLMIYRRSDYGM